MTQQRNELFESLQESVFKLAQNYVQQNKGQYLYRYGVTEGEVEDVSRMLCSILLHKWELASYPAGGFVGAMLKNDLMGAFGRVDSINIKAMHFYVVALTSLGMNEEVRGVVRELKELEVLEG